MEVLVDPHILLTHAHKAIDAAELKYKNLKQKRSDENDEYLKYKAIHWIKRWAYTEPETTYGLGWYINWANDDINDLNKMKKKIMVCIDNNAQNIALGDEDIRLLSKFIDKEEK